MQETPGNSFSDMFKTRQNIHVTGLNLAVWHSGFPVLSTKMS